MRTNFEIQLLTLGKAVVEAAILRFELSEIGLSIPHVGLDDKKYTDTIRSLNDKALALQDELKEVESVIKLLTEELATKKRNGEVKNV